MGFLFHAVKIPTALTATLFLNIWSHLKVLIFAALTRLDLYKPPPPEDDPADYSNNFIYILEGTCPSLVPIPIHVVTAAIKNRVPVMLYQEFVLKGLEKIGNPEAEEAEQQQQKVCTICFESVEERHEVRDLPRCSHVFHRFCLDKWVDSNQVTCPLCRSMLLPPKTNLSRYVRDPPRTEMEEEGNHRDLIFR